MESFLLIFVKEIAEKSHSIYVQKYGETYLSDFLKKSCQEKYGVNNPMQVQEIARKSTNTHISLYGSRYLYESSKKTCMELYNVDNFMKVKSFADKNFQARIEKFGGVQNFPNYKVTHQKFLDLRLKQVKELGLEWVNSDDFCGKYKNNGPVYYIFKCLKCGHIFKGNFHGTGPKCDTCHPRGHGISLEETDVYNFVKSIYKGDIERHNRTVLKRKELDIFFPDLKIAIEYDGVYWHGFSKNTKKSLEQFVDDINFKRNRCEEKEIRLITISEMDWIYHKERFKCFLEDLFLPRKRIYARNCILVNIEDYIAEDFCNKYHLHGFVDNYDICYGLIYNTELVSVAVFEKNEDEFQCSRYCCKGNIDIVGGLQKIASHFKVPFKFYIDLRYFRGKNVTGNGFRLVSKESYIGANNGLLKDLVGANKLMFKKAIANDMIAVIDKGYDIRLFNQG